jgi:hypothetical protein
MHIRRPRRVQPGSRFLRGKPPLCRIVSICTKLYSPQPNHSLGGSARIVRVTKPCCLLPSRLCPCNGGRWKLAGVISSWSCRADYRRCRPWAQKYRSSVAFCRQNASRRASSRPAWCKLLCRVYQLLRPAPVHRAQPGAGLHGLVQDWGWWIMDGVGLGWWIGVGGLDPPAAAQLSHLCIAHASQARALLPCGWLHRAQHLLR